MTAIDDPIPRDASRAPASRLVWARLDAPWLTELAEAQAAGRFDTNLLGDEPLSMQEAERAHLSTLVEATSVLLPGADANGPKWFAEALRTRRLAYVDRLLSVSRAMRGAL